MSEWLFDYVHSPNMNKEEYLAWRPSYRNLLGIKKPIVAEIGILEGFNSRLALKYIDFGKYYLIDPYKEYNQIDIGNLHIIKQEEWDNLYNQVKERFKNNSNVELIRVTSEEASKLFPDETFDFVYIDADHNYQSVWNDINYWYPKVKKNGYLGGHDVEFGDVKSVVYKFYLTKYEEQKDKFIDMTIDTGYNDWWIKKI